MAVLGSVRRRQGRDGDIYSVCYYWSASVTVRF